MQTDYEVSPVLAAHRVTTTPISILTGFLGSGKTTLLRELLRSPRVGSAAVLVNELGEIPLDHDLVREVREDLIVLGSGCVCCSVRNDLVRALCDLYMKRKRGDVPAFDRVLIETTGLADPTPILGTLAKNGLVRSVFELATVVVAVDGELGIHSIQRHPEVAKQITAADRIIFTKADRVDIAKLDTLEAHVAGMNPMAERLRSALGQVPARLFLERAPDWPQPTVLAAGDQAGAHDTVGEAHGVDVRSFSETFEEAIDFRAFALWVSMMTQIHGEHILRMKAIVHARGETLPLVAQAVQHVVFPVETLSEWPCSPPASRVVVITRGLEPDVFNALRGSLHTLLRVDPDAGNVVT